MVIGVGNSLALTRILKFGTHDGGPHIDETLGMAILCLAFCDRIIVIIRSRDPKVLSQLDIVLDVGGGEYDHHMAGYNVRRPTGELYASAGLAWSEFGIQVIKNVASDMGVELDDDTLEAIQEEIDREVIVPIDQEDNGELFSLHLFSFISYYLPTWLQDPNFDEEFKRSMLVASDVMVQIVETKIAKFAAKKELVKKIPLARGNILEIPSQRMPWLEDVVEYNKNHNNSIKFVIFPHPSGGWAAQSVPPSVKEKFKQLVSFPESWAGGNEKTLPTITGIPDATFCHNGRFFVRAKTMESVIKMCRIAMGLE